MNKKRGDEDILQELIEGNNNLKWFSENFEKLKEKYPNKYVAMKDTEVIMDDKNFDNLASNLKKEFGDISRFEIKFIPDDEFILVV